MHHTYINGRVIPSNIATVGINDLGLMRGYGLFDFFRTYNGRPFEWDLYWARFNNSAKLMNLEIPISKEKAYETVLTLLKISGHTDTAFRFLLTGGYSFDSITSLKTNLLISSEDIPVTKPEAYENGMAVITHEFVRDLPEIKSTDYKHLLILQAKIKAAGATDVLFHQAGEVSELSRSNIFIFKSGKLLTPKNNVLNGITRQVVMKLAQPHFEVLEQNLTIEDLLTADEVFTTSSTKKVLPITSIDGQLINNKKIGENSTKLLDLFNNYVKIW